MKKIISPILLLILLVGCQQHNKDLENSIHAAAKENNEIDISNLSEFKWDRAYLITPYSTEEEIENQLGAKFNDKSNIDFRDDIYLLIFLHEDEVVQYINLKRQGLDFSIGENDFLTPSDDRLYVERYK